MIKPDPCPFCTSLLISTRVDLARFGENDRVHLQCTTCLASGPAHYIQAVPYRSQDQLEAAIRHATRLWNDRRPS